MTSFYAIRPTLGAGYCVTTHLRRSDRQRASRGRGAPLRVSLECHSAFSGGGPALKTAHGSSTSGTRSAMGAGMSGHTFVGRRNLSDRIDSGVVPSSSVKPFSFASSATT